MSVSSLSENSAGRAGAAGSRPIPLDPTVQKRVEEARHLIFRAHSIAAVAAAAAQSENAPPDCMETTLSFVADMLDGVAALLDPVTLGRPEAAS